MAGRRPFNNAPGGSLEQRAKQRQLQIEKRSSMTSAIAATMARKASIAPAPVQPPPRLQRDVECYLAALEGMPFHITGSNEDVTLSAAYRELVRSSIEVMNDGIAQVVMSWPLSQTCPSGVIALIALGSIGSARRSSTQWSKACHRIRGIRLNVSAQSSSPYARSTHAPAREVQIDRDRLGTLNFEHLKRVLSENEDTAFKDYHQVLCRVRGLNGRATDGRTYAEFEHPILDEIVPHGPPKGDRASNSELLWRTRSKTDIGKQTRSGDADDPTKAHFYVYTIRERDRLGVQLRAITAAPDLMILDLSRVRTRQTRMELAEARQGDCRLRA